MLAEMPRARCAYCILVAVGYPASCAAMSCHPRLQGHAGIADVELLAMPAFDLIDHALVPAFATVKDTFAFPLVRFVAITGSAAKLSRYHVRIQLPV